MPEIHDPMTTTLEALRSDVERTPLADSLAVRRRGDQRTRRQAVGGALVVAALVAGAVGYLTGGLTGDNEGLPPATGGPTATTSVETPQLLTADPLLKPADLSGALVGPYTGWQANPDPVAEGNEPSLCVPRPASLAAAEVQSVLLYSDLDAQMTEHVLRFDNEEDSKSAFLRIAGSFEACDPGDPTEVSVKDRGPSINGPVEGVSETLNASRLTTPVADADINYYELGVARVQNVLVILQWTSMGKPKDAVPWVYPHEFLDIAAHRAVNLGS